MRDLEKKRCGFIVLSELRTWIVYALVLTLTLNYTMYLVTSGDFDGHKGYPLWKSILKRLALFLTAWILNLRQIAGICSDKNIRPTTVMVATYFTESLFLDGLTLFISILKTSVFPADGVTILSMLWSIAMLIQSITVFVRSRTCCSPLWVLLPFIFPSPHHCRSGQHHPRQDRAVRHQQGRREARSVCRTV